jgi:hypothetical protein
MSVDFLMLQTPSYVSPLDIQDQNIHTGLDLPDNVLKKVYYENASRLLARIIEQKR